ncbi:hypothetical protein ACLESO_09330 [Pyxidicoccus sp. 3LG]
MRRLRFRDVDAEDRLRLSCDGFFNRQAALETELEPFLHALETLSGEWMPGVVEGQRQRKYTRAAIWTSLEEARGENSAMLGFYRTTPPALELTLDLWFPPLPPGLRIWLDVQPLSFFAEEQRCQRFVDLVRAWASHYPPSYAAAHSVADRQLADFPNFGRDDETTRRDRHDKVYEVFWLNVFGPRLVETVGRERMLSAPAHRVEALPNGAILLMTSPTAADFASEQSRHAQARALVHLRPDLDFHTVLRTLLQRSATLAPVQPRFHPDLAPLLSRILDDFAISERQRKIAELNNWRPPEPDEWLPTALPPDVAAPDRVREHYAELAEHLVALLHSRVPSVLSASLESLTDVDFHLWYDNFPETFDRKNLDAHAVPAVGAYLGEVLVKHLGGQWIPRENLLEAQVRVGQRVWLPFLRAQRYLGSRQALLDFSLTHLRHVAERFR